MKNAAVVVGQLIRHSAEISLDALQILLQPLEPEQHSLTTWVVFGIQVVRRDDLLDAALAVTVDQLATTGRARRDGIIALNIKNRLPHCV